jgi:hypothetical protein
VPDLPKSWRNAAPMAAVLALVGLGMLLVANSRFRRGATLLAVAMALAAVLRLTVAEGRLGPLAVRSKAFDVLFCGGLAVILTVLVIVE